MAVCMTAFGRGQEQSRSWLNGMKQKFKRLGWCPIIKPEKSSFDPKGDRESL